MCGIYGVVSLKLNVPLDRSLLLRMNASLRHRGPNDEGYYQDDQFGPAMRRLSIIDLHTPQQPFRMNQATAGWYIIFRGYQPPWNSVGTASKLTPIPRLSSTLTKNMGMNV